jgi:hypothetical protein
LGKKRTEPFSVTTKLGQHGYWSRTHVLPG